MGRRIRYRPGGSEEQFASVGRARDESLLTPKIIITVAVVFMLVLVGIVLGGYFIIQNRKFQGEFAPLVDVCRDKWVNGASTYSATPDKHPAVAVRNSSSGWQLDAYLIRGEVLAESLAETQLVLCLGAVQEVFIESCPYIDHNGSGARMAVERYYYKQDAQLIEAKTGRVVTVQTFTGKSPHYCNKTQVFSRSDKIIKLTGTEISDDEVQRWLQSHLIIN